MFEQTDPEWNPDMFSDELGTGIFVRHRPSPQAPIRKDFVEDITYSECVGHARRGDYQHFKWVPHRIKTYDDIRLETCAGGPCQAAKDCFQTVCFCIGRKCT